MDFIAATILSLLVFVSNDWGSCFPKPCVVSSFENFLVDTKLLRPLVFTLFFFVDKLI